MLVRRSALDAAGGLTPMRGALIDDVAFGTLLKRNGSRIWLGLSTDIRSARPYPSLASLWHMIARSAYTQLRYNPALLAGTISGLLLLYAVPPAGVIAALIEAVITPAGGGPGASIIIAGLAGLLGWALMTVSYLPMLRFYRLSPLRAPRASAGRPALRRDDRRLGAPPLLRSRRLLARPSGRARLRAGCHSPTLAGAGCHSPQVADGWPGGW